MAHGAWDPEFEEVVSTLDATVAARGEGGASVCVYHRGRPVVDAWTGTRGAEVEWTSDTLVMAFSTTKGVASTLLHQCVDRGLLDYDDRVAEHWPEFAVNGKAEITVRQVLSHRAGLFDLTGVASSALDLLDWERMVDGVAAMTPAFEPGSASAYHAVTFGWLVGGLIERATNTAFRDVLTAQIVDPLGLDGCFIGAPSDQLSRVAALLRGGLADEMAADPGELVEVARQLGFTVRPELIAAALPAWVGDLPIEEALEVPIPAANGCFTARSLARIYAALAAGGTVDGVRILGAETVRRATEVQQATEPDLVLALPMSWRLGYHGVMTTAGVHPEAFGHQGLGGSGAYADPERDLAVAYLPNALGSMLAGDLRLLEIGGAAARAADAA